MEIKQFGMTVKGRKRFIIIIIDLGIVCHIFHLQRKKHAWQSNHKIYIEKQKQKIENEKHILYGLWNTAIFLKINGRKMDIARNSR